MVLVDKILGKFWCERSTRFSVHHLLFELHAFRYVEVPRLEEVLTRDLYAYRRVSGQVIMRVS